MATTQLLRVLAPRTFAVASLLLVSSQATAHGESLQYQVKAEFLERFTRFVEWPASSFASADTPFVICVIGTNPFGSYVEDMVKTRKIQGRKIKSRYSMSAETDGCHLVFIARDGPAKAVLSQTSGKPVLTVADTPGLIEAGVLINFFLEKGFVRFQINVGASKKSGLKFSAKLYELGRSPSEG